MTRAPLCWFRVHAGPGARWHAMLSHGTVYACGRRVAHRPDAVRADCRQQDRCVQCARLVRVLQREAG